MSEEGSAQKKARKRYSQREKDRVLEVADRVGVEEAVKKTGVSTWSIYRWRKARRLAQIEKAGPAPECETTQVVRPARIQVPQRVQHQVVAVWRNNPGFGPSQVSGQLRRLGVMKVGRTSPWWPRPRTCPSSWITVKTSSSWTAPGPRERGAPGWCPRRPRSPRGGSRQPAHR